MHTLTVSGPLFIVLAGGLVLGWYIAGNELMRRRSRRLARWCRETATPLGGALAIRWLTSGSFQLEIQHPDQPMQSGMLTGLVESFDVIAIWLWNHLRGRRDMVLLQLTLDRRPIWGLELYRPHSILAGDARHRAHEERWDIQILDGFHYAAAGGEAPLEFARTLLSLLAAQRQNVLRLAVRRQGVHLSLALNVPNPSNLPAGAFCGLIRDLIQATLSYTTPSD